MILADHIRAYVIDEIIQPARQRGEVNVRIRAGDVHAALGFNQRMPAVVSAIGAQVFQDQAHVELVGREGPHEGANTVFFFQLI